MDKSTISLGGAVIAGIIAIIALFSGGGEATVGGTTQSYFDAQQGFRVNGTTVIDSSGNFDGAVTSGSDSTFAGTVSIQDTASSTLYVGDNGASDNAGCLVLGDSAATGTAVYITASGETVTASTTAPAACQSL